jgi:hypothetical protein
MATQSHTWSTTAARGDASSKPSPNGPTPAPIKPVVPPGEFGNHLDEFRGNGYGRGQSSLPSSLAPGQAVISDFNISPKGGDPVLDVVRNQGTARRPTADTSGRVIAHVDDGQLRTIGANNVPTHFAMKGPADAPKVPGAIDKTATENPVRKPPSLR